MTQYAIRVGSGQYLHRDGKPALFPTLQDAKGACRPKGTGIPRSIVRLKTKPNGMTYAESEAEIHRVCIYNGLVRYKVLPFK